MKDLNIEKVLQLTKKMEKTLQKKIEKLRENVTEFVDFRLDLTAEERPTYEKLNRREEIGVLKFYSRKNNYNSNE